MEMYTACLVQQISALDKPYAPYRSEEDAYYAIARGFEAPHWLVWLSAALPAWRRHRVTTPGARTTSVHVTQMA